MSAATDRFANARTNESLLNSRQREVLDLLVAGKTNGEIAHALGMTLDGAKWNVSEILGKLALDSREDAAEYWRNRKSSRSPVTALRGLLGIGALKWAGGIAAVAVIGIALAGLFTRDDDSRGAQLPPFYIEATMDSLDASRSIGTNPAGSPITERNHRLMHIRWWQRDIDHMRVEIETIEPADEAGTDIILIGGDRQVYYRFETNTYTETPLPDFPDEAKLRRRPWSFGTFLGPWMTEVGSLDDIISELHRFGSENHPPATIEVVGRERFLGVDADIVEYSPASTSTNQDGTTTGKGTIRYWIDSERLIVLKQVLEGDDGAVQTFSIEATKLDWDTKISGERFKFDPPKGAERVDDNSAAPLADSGGGSSSHSGESAGGITFDTPPGLLRAISLPDGFRAVSVEDNHDSAGNPTTHQVEYAHEDGRRFVVAQRIRKGGPAGQLIGDPVQAGSRTVFVSEGAGSTVIQWAQGDLILRITSADLPKEDLLRVAESLQPQP